MFSNKKTHPHKLFLIWLFACLFSINSLYSQQQTDSISITTIAEALNNGEIEKLANLFNTKVDITLPDQSGIYSCTQAYFILKDFFKKNPPTSFQIINESLNNGSNFIVGKMHTANQHFRVGYLTKYENNKLYIYQFRIEK